MAKYHQGKYRPINPDKYLGDIKDIVYRSGWEFKIFKWLDHNPHILRWGSEVVVVPYICGTDHRKHRYFVDVIYENIKNEVYLVEIKPHKETIMPVTKNNRKTKRLKESMKTYVKNMSKWAAASQFAEKKGWKFKIFTEKTIEALGIKL